MPNWRQLQSQMNAESRDGKNKNGKRDDRIQKQSARSGSLRHTVLGPIDRHREFLESESGDTGLGDALVFAVRSLNPYEIPVSPN
jgi:hypothetical protein